MQLEHRGRAISPQVTGLLLSGFLLGLAGCQATPEPAQVVQTTRRDPAAAARLVSEVQKDVSAQVEVADDLGLKLWATEDLLIDPHALSIDHQGSVYVASSGRTRTQRAVNKHFRSQLASTLKHQTVEDLRSFLRTKLSPELSVENDEWLPDLNEDGSHDWRDLTVQKERVYRIQDTDGDGLADLSEVIVEDFHTEVTDIIGGLLVHDNSVYVGAAPGLWRLRDVSGDGVPDIKETLSQGYGTRLGFFAHGMSGITLGPDGRIYWAIGDVGLNVVDRDGKRWSYPNQGAILRANPDGSDFEVFAAGLRNLYEFAFDEYGNLIGADNDGDQPGEKERLVHVVDGSDSGWRTNWQYGKYTDPKNNRYRVWMDERLSIPRFEGQAAHITPPIAPYVNGPAGMAYNPGTALSEKWRGYFFIAENTGAQSSVHAFRLAGQGASFELVRDTVVVNGLLTTSMDFGPDGALYLADLVVKVKPELGGRIWKLDAPATAASPLRAQTKALLAVDFSRHSVTTLRAVLSHPDMRVRMKAQFALVDRSAARALLAAAQQTDHQLARLHGLWGIGQLARQDAKYAAPLTAFLRDPDPEIRAQAAKTIGDVRYEAAADALMLLLRDDFARPRFFAAEALGRIGYSPAVQPIIGMLAANNDEDAYLRHAGSLALARIGDAGAVVSLADHPSRAVRIAAVVALRRMQHPGVARFLGDRDEYIVTEAARAINDDLSIEAALPELARVLDQGRFSNEALVRRAINANLRLGKPEAAQRLAAYAARSRAPEAMRVEAIAALGVLPEPSDFDRVDGMFRAAERRDPAIAQAALVPLIEPLLATGTAAAKVALVEAAGRLDLDTAAPALLTRVRVDRSPKVRIAALRALHAMGTDRVEEAVRMALTDREPDVRKMALALAPELKLPKATVVELLASVLERGSVEEQQSAIEALGTLQNPHAQRVLGTLLDELSAGTLPPELQLDVIEAVRASNIQALHARLEQYLAARPADVPLAAFHATLWGGNAASGRQVVFENEAAACTRCHTLGQQGSTVGPNLSKIGSTLTRQQLLQALVDPSARIAPGFGTPNTPSGMPSMGQILSPREIRDVVEYLGTLQ